MFRRRDTARRTPARRNGSSGRPSTWPLLPSYPPAGLPGPARPGLPGGGVEAARGRRPQRLRLVPRLRAARRHRAARASGTCAGHESDYLGGVDLAGKRVLELGPATGAPDLLHGAHGRRGRLLRGRVRRPHRHAPGQGPTTSPRGAARASCRTPSTATTTAGGTCTAPSAPRPSSSRGTSTTCPPTSATFDVTVVGAILLHLREPWGALSQAARRTTETMIVTEPLQDDLDPPESNIMRFSPVGRAPPHQLVVDLSGRRRLHAGPARLRRRPRRPCTPSATTWRTTSGATPSTSRCTPSSGGPIF